jgi:hypothetical protein
MPMRIQLRVAEFSGDASLETLGDETSRRSASSCNFVPRIAVRNGIFTIFYLHSQERIL